MLNKDYSGCPEEKCYVDYCYDFNDGTFIGSFGRWATPHDEAHHTLCMEECNNAVAEPFVIDSQAGQNFANLFNIQSEIMFKGDSLSGLLEMDFNSRGDLFLLDVNQSRVIIFDENLNQINSFGNYGNERGEFERASDIFIDEKDNVYITDAYLAQVNIFSPIGELQNIFPLKNQATDMIVIEENFCTHTGGAFPKDSVAVNCYDKNSGIFQKSLVRHSELVDVIAWGFSNVTFKYIEKAGNKIVTLQHPMDATLRIFDIKGNVMKRFTVENEIFQQPDMPEKWNPLVNNPNSYVDQMLDGLHVIQDKIVVVFVEMNTGFKSLDIYNFDGERLVDEVINIGKHWPAYSDENGNLYAFSKSEEEDEYYLRKYKPTDYLLSL